MSDWLTELRGEFPALDQQIHGRPLHYFDNAATTLKPRAVIAAVRRYDSQDTANVHRGLHTLSARATTAYEAARGKLAQWFQVPENEIVYTRGTTEAINIVAHCWARPRLQAGDEILISTLEHHANIVPWQMVCEATGARLRAIPLDAEGQLDQQAALGLINPQTRLLAISAASNAIGSRTNLPPLIAAAKTVGARVLVDGAQIAAREPMRLAEMDIDFFACSAHKMFGPTGTGMLWAKQELLDAMPPWMGGGDMIEEVRLDGTRYAAAPWKFEAGTPNISGFIGWSAGLDFLAQWDHSTILAHEDALLEQAQQGLEQIPGLRVLGPRQGKLPLVSFVVEGLHEQDLATLLDENGIAVRTGHHCAMPLMQALGVRGTVRASFSAYNTASEVDHLVSSMGRIVGLLRR